VPASTAKLLQNWIATNRSEFIGKDEWPPNSPDADRLDHHVFLNTAGHFIPSQRTVMT